MKCGGTSAPKVADEEIQMLCDNVKHLAQEKAGKNFDVFKAKTYVTQVVAGTNFFIKVQVGNDDHIHICVFKNLPHTGSELQVLKILEGKSHDEPIGYF